LLIATHAHYDHIGNLSSFPAAEVVMAEREYAFWTGPLGSRPLFAAFAEAEDIEELRQARLHAALAVRGIDYLDAGVSGGAAAAEKGTLTIMVGGSAAALGAIAGVLEPVAGRVLHMGGSGAGQLTKVLNNFLNAVSLAATAEVMLAAKKAGLGLEQVLEAINSSSGVNFATPGPVSAYHPGRLPRRRPELRADDQGHRPLRGLPA
jgi:NAD-binding of NADP-dependent 3-hydroxyisobutyrate dehydrogenase/NAD binding domain of 6-phosphogluconate dehydrogenase